MPVLRSFVTLEPQLVRTLPFSPSTFSVFPIPSSFLPPPRSASSCFSRFELSTLNFEQSPTPPKPFPFTSLHSARPQLFSFDITPQNRGVHPSWSYQFAEAKSGQGEPSPTTEAGHWPGSHVRIHWSLGTGRWPLSLLLHYPFSRIEQHCIPPSQEGSHANSLHSMDRRTEIPRHQPLRPRRAVRFRPRIEQSSRGHGDGADGARRLHRHGHGPDPRKKAPEAGVARGSLLRRARRRAAHRLDEARSPLPPARHDRRSRRPARHVPHRGKILLRRRHAEKNRRLLLLL